ncbi:MAG: FprA family A-type flavoprotein [Chloroflexota bacterium]|nr:FprA family A-type flavoprotein [Chloroflexota bacterium]
MAGVTIKNDVYWVGAIDWNVRNFHGYSTHLGTTYNAYLVLDSKIALIDTVKAPFYEEMMGRIRQIVDPMDIDVIVSNHVEMDHSGSLPMVMKEAGKATLITAERFGESGLKDTFHADWELTPVKEGDELSLGRRKLVFIPTPMLHWPDSMATYLAGDDLLFSMDAFGQHIASSQRFDDEVGLDVVMPQAAKYYANILMPFGDLIVKAVDKLGGLKFDTIATSHGVVWRSHASEIVDAYRAWGRGDARAKALVIYDTMWGSTETMARALVEGIAAEGVEARLFNLSKTDRSDVIHEVLDARALLVGSPTLNNGLFPTVADFLCYLKGLKPRGKVGAAFGSHGWAGGAVKAIESELRAAGVEILDSDLAIKYVPDEATVERCRAFGGQVASRIKGKE